MARWTPSHTINARALAAEVAAGHSFDETFARHFANARIGAQLPGTGAVIGVEECKAALRNCRDVVLMASAEGSRRMQDEVFRASQAMCPYDEGELHDSGHGESDEGANVDISELEPGEEVSKYWLTAQTKYGPQGTNWYRVVYDAGHALAVHENYLGLAFKQGTNPNPPFQGQPVGDKFLRRAIDILTPRLGSNVQRLLAAALASTASQVAMTAAARPVAARGLSTSMTPRLGKR